MILILVNIGYCILLVLLISIILIAYWLPIDCLFICINWWHQLCCNSCHAAQRRWPKSRIRNCSGRFAINCISAPYIVKYVQCLNQADIFEKTHALFQKQKRLRQAWNAQSGAWGYLFLSKRSLMLPQSD